jgi:translation initiation factor IF-2
MIILVSEMEELTADPKGKFEGVVIESKMNHQRGPTATILVKNGTLKIGDEVTCEEAFGRIKAMFDENDRQVLVAPPGKPVEVLGFKEVVAVGSKVLGKMLSKPLARPDGKPADRPERELISPKAPQDVTFKIILKTDVKGSQEAISENLPKEIGIVKAQTGDINESDILLAKATGAAIIGFNVKVSPSLYKLANEEKVKIKTYEIIYKLLEEIDEAVKALTSVPAEEVFGRGEIIAEFIVKEERVAGVKIISGKICRGDKIKILRGEKEVGRGRIKSIHHLKEEIPMAEMGTECGISFSPKLDFEEKDVIISYKI